MDASGSRIRFVPDGDPAGVAVIEDPPIDSVHLESWRAHVTTGSYATEDEAKSAFISRVNDDHWDVYQEVDGEVILPKLGCDRRKVRADFMLFPKPSLVANGWCVGPLCVEVKRSGEKLGPVICQAQDYMRCAFSGPSGIMFIPRYCVIFPLSRIGGSVQSIMSDGRIGHSHIERDDTLRIYLNGQMAYTHKGGVFLRSAMKSGKKFGSR